MSAVQESFETLSVRSLDLDERDKWAAQSEAINSEIQDILVDVLVVFSQLPNLDGSQQTVDAWALAFDQLFELVPGLRPVFEMAPLDDAELRFEGRPGRFYLPIEEEYFLATFFQDFWDMLMSTQKLGDLAVGGELADPRDDSINVYEYVKERKNGGARRRSRRESAFREARSAVKSSSNDRLAGSESENVRKTLEEYLSSLVDVPSSLDPFDKLLNTTQFLHDQSGNQASRFFLTFKRQEFATLYVAVRGTPALLALLDVLTKYFLEFQTEPHVFNAPDIGTFIKDLKRAKKRDSASSN